MRIQFYQQTILVLLTLGLASCYEFLVVSFHDSGSHQASMSKLFLELASRGHHITVVDTTSKKPPNYGPNVTVVHFPDDRPKPTIFLRMFWETYPQVWQTP
uniref:Glucuronosyltransferase n=1 Tax=Panagrellus redivivus TaxID=6233 RepID=A0A7E4WC61_PANRE